MLIVRFRRPRTELAFALLITPVYSMLACSPGSGSGADPVNSQPDAHAPTSGTSGSSATYTTTSVSSTTTAPTTGTIGTSTAPASTTRTSTTQTSRTPDDGTASLSTDGGGPAPTDASRETTADASLDDTANASSEFAVDASLPTSSDVDANTRFTSDVPESTGDAAEQTSGDSSHGGTTSMPPPVVCNATTLKEAGACTGRLVGTAIGANQLNNNQLTTIARTEFNYITAENEMKWSSLQPSRGNFNFTQADRIVNFALQNGMQVKGHTLVWHSQLPSWVQNLATAEEVRQVMTTHIRTVMNHFKGKVVAWDVVNEAWANPNDWVNGQPTLRNSVFYRRLGERFIDEAFIIARETDPNVKLYYNDFRSEAVGQPKGDAIYEMVKGMVERGVPIDGVGLQTHLGLPNDKPAIENIIANMQRIADLGLEVIISELDGHLCDGETFEQQGTRFYDIAKACFDQPACTAFTVWGIGDGDSWLNSWNELNCMGRRPSGLLWDDNLNKKPAYEGILAGLNGK